MQPNDPTTPDNTNAEPQTAPEATPASSTDPNAAPQPVNPETTPPETSAAASVFAADPVPAAAPQKKGFLKSKKAKLVALVAVIFVVLGGSAAAYYGVILPNQPQRIAQQAIANTINQEKVKSGFFEGEVSFSGGEVSQGLSSISFVGSSNQEGAINLTLTANTAVTKINFDLKSQDSKTLYVRLSGLDGLDKLLGMYTGGSSDEAAFIATLAPVISHINNQWYTLDESLLNQLGGGVVSAAENKISSEDAKKIGEIYKKHQFLQIDKKLADEKIHGVNSYHIQASINKDQLTGFLNEVKSADIKALPIEQEMIDEVAKVDFSKYPFELWVSKSDRVITQVATSFEQDDTKVKVRVALFDINKPVTVDKPEDAKSVLELLGELSPLTTDIFGGSSNATDLPLITQ